MPSGKCGSGAIRAGEGLLGIHRELCKGVYHPTPFPGHVCNMGPTEETGGLKGGSSRHAGLDLNWEWQVKSTVTVWMSESTSWNTLERFIHHKMCSARSRTLTWGLGSSRVCA